jgi:PAS domain-containing protein
MKQAEFRVRAADDPRLAVHATSPLPAWLWSTDGTRVLWANPVAARLFGVSSGTSLSNKLFGPADPHRRQVARLAPRLLPNEAIRMERLRGFGAALGTLVTCACARLEFAGGEEGILIAAVDPLPRTMPLVERLQRLVGDADEPVAAFESDGRFVAASPAAAPLFHFQSLADAGLEEARLAALKEGRIEAPLNTGRVTLQRVGSRADLGLLAFITPGQAQARQMKSADRSPELPASQSEPPN